MGAKKGVPPKPKKPSKVTCLVCREVRAGYEASQARVGSMGAICSQCKREVDDQAGQILCALVPRGPTAKHEYSLAANHAVQYAIAKIVAQGRAFDAIVGDPAPGQAGEDEDDDQDDDDAVC